MRSPLFAALFSFPRSQQKRDLSAEGEIVATPTLRRVHGVHMALCATDFFFSKAEGLRCPPSMRCPSPSSRHIFE